MSSVTRILDYLQANMTDEPEPEYLCAACKDTTWVETDDGLEDGRRVRSPKAARCTSLLHQRAVPSEPTPERFS